MEWSGDILRLAAVEPERTRQVAKCGGEDWEGAVRARASWDILELGIDRCGRSWCREGRAGLREARLADGVVLRRTARRQSGKSVNIPFKASRMAATYKKKVMVSPVFAPSMKFGWNVRVLLPPTTTLNVVCASAAPTGRRAARAVEKRILKSLKGQKRKVEVAERNAVCRRKVTNEPRKIQIGLVSVGQCLDGQMRTYTARG